MFNQKKGQAIFIGIMIFVMLFIVIVQFINPLKDEITTARSVDNLDCGNSSITVGTKATCIVVDFTLFYFIGIAIAAGAGAITILGAKRFLKQ